MGADKIEGITHNYVEAQIHGGISADDIAEVVSLELPRTVIASLKNRGIQWRTK